MTHPIKSFALSDVEAAIAKALQDMTGKRTSVSVSSLNIEEQSPFDKSMGNAVEATLQLAIRSEPHMDYSKGFDN